MKKNNKYDNDFTYEQLMRIRDRDPWLLKELCRKFLWIYCMVTEPDFYNAEHIYLKKLCDEIQEFYESDEKYMIISIPPQHGKSRTVKKAEEWILGNNPKIRFFSISYNEEYATDSSKNLLTAIKKEKETEDEIVFKDIFNGIRVKRGEGAVNRWSLDKGYNTWLSAGMSSGVTGRSANIVVVDDIIKDYETAINKKALKKIWNWFSNTLFSRRGDNNRKMIIVMTRWSKDDLAGIILKKFKNVRNLVMKAYDPETNKMLCDEILNYESYQEILSTSSEDLIEANYNQRPIDLKGQLYTRFNTYKVDDIRNGQYRTHRAQNSNDVDKYSDFKRICCVTDTADEGSDWLCSIVFGETYDKKAYVLDVYYSKASIEITMPDLARFIKRNNVRYSVTESNNGGKAFTLGVKKELEGLNYRTIIKWFHQSKNKKSRILSNSKSVMDRIYFPEDWDTRWREYYIDMNEYQKEGEMEHDDAQDCTTMIIELMDGRLITN